MKLHIVLRADYPKAVRLARAVFNVDDPRSVLEQEVRAYMADMRMPASRAAQMLIRQWGEILVRR